MMTAYGNIETAVEAMKRGAVDFLTKPVNIERLEVLIQRALKTKTLEVEVKQLHERLDEKFKLRGHHRHFAEAEGGDRQDEARRAVARDDPDRGRVGHGQGTDRAGDSPVEPARARRRSSRCIARRFRRTCSRAKSSATSAARSPARPSGGSGVSKSADGGTLFLDEIGEISQSTQVKLLRFLETKAIERVGGSKPIELDVRLVAATNRNLEQMVREGKFREDLFFRLERRAASRCRRCASAPEDIPLLLAHFIKMFSEENGVPPLTVEPGALRTLQAYPGRETSASCAISARTPSCCAAAAA